ncbi:MAG: DUF881 domain-containing protein [Tepidibacter sp.]|uniref:DUF881 domain-containing protein n=1 Tax=Tepidibacter sp. TaxID=2529387 RepID=UPI0025DAD74C|nr:DUF881 domain-containing protein [Tepidibacter sp.]MCT4508533.1 DUF881 domain-containing protein [Tepidibacter sp.]
MKKNSLSLLILSFFLGMLIIIEFKTVDKTTGGLVSSQKANQLSIELKSLTDRKKALEKDVQELDERIQEYKDSEAEKNVLVKNLKEDTKKYETLAGYYDVSGPGVVITMKEPQETTGEKVLLYNYDQILTIINKLNAAGAEAISINGERYVSSTEMYLSGEKVILNGNPIMTPFEIKCIGNSDILESALNIRFGIIYQLRNEWNLDVDVKKQDSIEIPRYNKTIEFKYAKPLESNVKVN